MSWLAHGGPLRNLFLSQEALAAERARCNTAPSWNLSHRQICDLELLLSGGFSPLTGFMGESDYDRVVEEMRLADGILFPVPVTLDVTEEFAGGVEPGAIVALRDGEGVAIATLEISGIWRPDKRREALRVYGTDDAAHPGVDFLFNHTHALYVGGRVKGLAAVSHYDFRHLRESPAELREKFRKRGWNSIVAFHTRQPLHRPQQELLFGAARLCEANLLLHPAVGPSASRGETDPYARVRCYEHIVQRFPEQTTALSLLPLAARMAGPREALWHAIIRRNFGCTHFIVGRNHGGPGEELSVEDFYPPYSAQELVAMHEREIAIRMVPVEKMLYAPERAQFLPARDHRKGEAAIELDPRELRRRLEEGLEIPEWYSYPEILQELRAAHPPRHEQGFTVFFTGLSGAGKSTIANAVVSKLREIGGRSVTLLDGDVVRSHLSSELGFSRAHRDLNIRRIGYVASEITKNGGVAICAPIAPYAVTRKEVRDMIAPHGGFIEVYVSTPISVCEARDRKGLYAKARAGLLKGFTGVDDPYEAPENAEITIDSSRYGVDEAAQRIILKLEGMGYIR